MRVILFYLIACAFSWAIAGWLYTQGGLGANPTIVGLSLVAMMFGPAVGAVIMTMLFDRGRFFESLGFLPFKPLKTFVWIIIGWLVPLALIALATLATFAITGLGPADVPAMLHAQASAALEARGSDFPLTAEQFFYVTLFVNLPIGILINTVLITLNEEMGWRGWLQPRLKGLGFWPMSILIGALWGFWHAPIVYMGYNYPGMEWTGVGLMVVFTILVTPYFSLVRERSGNVWAAGAMHGSLNAAAGIGIAFIQTPAWPYNGLMGIGGFAVLLVGWVLIALYRGANPYSDRETISEG